MGDAHRALEMITTELPHIICTVTAASDCINHFIPLGPPTHLLHDINSSSLNHLQYLFATVLLCKFVEGCIHIAFSEQ